MKKIVIIGGIVFAFIVFGVWKMRPNSVEVGVDPSGKLSFKMGLEPPKSTNSAQPQTSALPSSSCPTIVGMVSLPNPHTWYYALPGRAETVFWGVLYDGKTLGFATWDPNQSNENGAQGKLLQYADPTNNLTRVNTWIPLNQSNFQICVDQNRHVFAAPMGSSPARTNSQIDPEGRGESLKTTSSQRLLAVSRHFVVNGA